MGLRRGERLAGACWRRVRICIVVLGIAATAPSSLVAQQSVGDSIKKIFASPTPTPHRKKKGSPTPSAKKKASPSPDVAEEKSSTAADKESPSASARPKTHKKASPSPKETASPSVSPSETPPAEKSASGDKRGIPNASLAPEAIT